MKILVDTNAYTAFKRGVSQVLSTLQNADIVYLSIIVLSELYAGFYAGNQVDRNIHELELFISKPGICCLDITKEIADRYGIIVKKLKLQETPIPTNDIWIAGSALETGSKILTADRHFEAVPGLVIV
jgi:tRNA(fMet)-specific endonuclease VapC